MYFNFIKQSLCKEKKNCIRWEDPSICRETEGTAGMEYFAAIAGEK